MTTEPGTPQTAAGRAVLRSSRLPQADAILAIEAEARAARDAEIRAAVERMRTYPFQEAPYVRGPHAMVLLSAVIAIIDADTPS